MSLLESGENYLETILVLTKRNGSVRSIDIAEEMNFTKASVSRAMSILKRDNYIIMEPDGRILLTKDGQKKATAVYDRHVTLTRFINEILGVDEEIAEKGMPAASSISSARKPLQALRACLRINLL